MAEASDRFGKRDRMQKHEQAKHKRVFLFRLANQLAKKGFLASSFALPLLKKPELP